MRMFLAFILTLGLATSGCAWLQWRDPAEAQTPEVQPQEEVTLVEAVVEPAPAPVKSASKSKAKVEKTARTARGAKSETEISAELDRVGHKLAAQASRTVMPSVAAKEVRKDGKDFVASYVEVDTSNVTTELRPGAKGQYVGFIRYQEKIYECRGASQQAALSAPCKQVRARRLNELIRYDGSAWQF